MLTAFHVTTLADEVAGSLRDAITQANSHAGADIVTFQPGLTGTIPLTGGEFSISDELTINGPGADKLTVNGNDTSRIFRVESSKSVRISLTIAGGNAGGENGGGIDSFGTLTVSGSTFTGNSASDNGGGIDNSGTATVIGGTFTKNTASPGNGGLNNETGGMLTQFDNQFLDDQTPDVFP